MKKITIEIRIAAIAAGLLVSSFAPALPIVWVGDANGNLGTVNVTTGATNVIGNRGHAMTDIAFGPRGNLYGITFGQLYNIDVTNAHATLIGNTSASLNSLVFDGAGNLYSANSSLFTIDTNTGAATVIGNGGDAYSSAGDLAFVDGQLYLSSIYGNNLTRIDTDSGFGHNIGSIGHGNVYGLATDDHVHLYGMSGTTVLGIGYRHRDGRWHSTGRLWWPRTGCGLGLGFCQRGTRTRNLRHVACRTRIIGFHGTSQERNCLRNIKKRGVF